MNKLEPGSSDFQVQNTSPTPRCCWQCQESLLPALSGQGGTLTHEHLHLFLITIEAPGVSHYEIQSTLRLSASSPCNLCLQQTFLPGEHGGHENLECLVALFLPGDAAICWESASHESPAPMDVVPATVTAQPQPLPPSYYVCVHPCPFGLSLQHLRADLRLSKPTLPMCMENGENLGICILLGPLLTN